MEFRRFNDAGVEAFRDHLARLRENGALPTPTHLLTNPDLTEPLHPRVAGEPRAFASRMEFARWLYHLDEASGMALPRDDRGFWSWLSLAIFDQTCPKNDRGVRKAGADARYIPELGNFHRRYRHLLANPYDIFLLHRDQPSRAMIVMNGPLHLFGDLIEQICSRQIVRCPGAMELASHLFLGSNGAVKRGVSGKTVARRLAPLMNQYRLTWDLPEIHVPTFVQSLPKDLHRFLST
jgi:hypothetical protein